MRLFELMDQGRSNNTKVIQTIQDEDVKYDFLKKYPQLGKCHVKDGLNVWKRNNPPSFSIDYAKPASNSTHNSQYLRG